MGFKATGKTHRKFAATNVEAIENSNRRVEQLELRPRLAFLQHDTAEVISYASYTADDPGPLDFDVRSDEILVEIGCTSDIAAGPIAHGLVRMSYRLTRLSDASIIQDAADARSAMSANIVDLPAGDSSEQINSIFYRRLVTGLIPDRYRLQAYYKTTSSGGGTIAISNRFVSAFHFPRGD